MYEDVKDYFKMWQMDQVDFDKNIEEQKRFSLQIKNDGYSYYAVTLPANWKLDGKTADFRYDRYYYKSLAMFKLISFTPMTIKGGVLTTPQIATYPSLILETMDGKRFEALEPKITFTRGNKVISAHMVYADDVFMELDKNFVHPTLRMNKNGVEKYHLSGFSLDDKGTWHTHWSDRLLTPLQATTMYEKWENAKPLLRKHVDSCLANEKTERYEHNQASNTQQAKVDAFESKFSQPSHKVFNCPKCGTANRVPVRNKRVEISCRCGHKYIVMC